MPYPADKVVECITGKMILICRARNFCSFRSIGAGRAAANLTHHRSTCCLKCRILWWLCPAAAIDAHSTAQQRILPEALARGERLGGVGVPYNSPLSPPPPPLSAAETPTCPLFLPQGLLHAVVPWVVLHHLHGRIALWALIP